MPTASKKKARATAMDLLNLRIRQRLKN